MFRKILLASSILAVTSGVALANPVPYVGAGLGINTNTSSNVANGYTIINGVRGMTYGAPGNFRGVPVNVFAGLGGMLNDHFYLAGELTGTVATAEISSNHGLKTTYGYGASVLPGLKLTDHTMAFARAAVVRTRFSSANTTETGGRVGLGLQTNVMQNFDIRGEYDFTAYGSFNNKIGRVASPRSDSFNLDLIYKVE